MSAHKITIAARPLSDRPHLLGFAALVSAGRFGVLKPIVFAGIIAGLIGFSGSPSVAQTDSGEFLAGRAAERSGDFEAAARYYGRALLFDPTNPALLHGALAAYLRLGNVEMAAEFAGHMRDPWRCRAWRWWVQSRCFNALFTKVSYRFD